MCCSCAGLPTFKNPLHIEIEPDGTVRQKRTMYDRQEADIEDAKKFLKKWQKEISRRLTDEERELAKTSCPAGAGIRPATGKSGNHQYRIFAWTFIGGCADGGFDGDKRRSNNTGVLRRHNTN